ncbi:MAG: cytochrome P450 [Solirubrobacteraceae bacterium]
MAQAVLWGLRYPQFAARCHRRFGHTFTLRAGTMEPSVVTVDGDAIARLLTGDPLTKRHANDVVRPLVGDDAVILIDGREHLARRKLLLPPFHGERVKGYGELLRRLTDEEAARWRAGDEVAILPIAQDLTIEVILQALLGVADEALRSRFRRLIDDTLFYPMGSLRLRLAAKAPRVALSQRWRAAIAFAASVGTPAVSTYFPEIKTRSRWNVATLRWWHHHDRLTALLDEQIAATAADPALAEREDILAMLIRARDEDGAALPAGALREDLLTLIAAGHETTAAAIAWGAVLLAHHPEVQARARISIRDGDERWLGALVKEILRHRPPLPVAAVRRLDEPFVIGEHTVPADTPLIVDAWSLHHDPARFPEPDRFDPERFLADGAEAYSWLPFGGGARRCIGASLAELEIRVALATMLRRWTLEPADRDLAPPARRGVVVVPQGGGRVRVSPGAC